MLHACSMGAEGEWVAPASDLADAFARAKAADMTYLIAIRTHPYQWTPGDAR